jgi:hypothetical protein
MRLFSHGANSFGFTENTEVACFDPLVECFKLNEMSLFFEGNMIDTITVFEFGFLCDIFFAIIVCGFAPVIFQRKGRFCSLPGGAGALIFVALVMSPCLGW